VSKYYPRSIPATITVNLPLVDSYASSSCVVTDCHQTSFDGHLKQIHCFLIPNNRMLHFVVIQEVR